MTFSYRNRGEQNWQKRDVHPCHIAYVENTWYVYGFDVKREAIRTFALMRLMQLDLCPGKFEPVKFNLAEYLRDSFRLYTGQEGDDYEVVIDFDAWAADEVRGHRCHESQELMELPKGMLRLTFRLNNLEEVERWVMSFGTHATVVRPKALQDRLPKTGVDLAARYGGDDSAA